CQQYDNDPRTF
nr:immunoglobulin light chain junction region [Macaca mulatta]MOW42388.1 immunoglobulin light chain junction region [Macaca mulatta]MOW43799.1 immunoglobulin light chain junction region [Macaca mulatta]